MLHGLFTLGSLSPGLLLSTLVTKSSTDTALDLASNLVLGSINDAISLGSIVLVGMDVRSSHTCQLRLFTHLCVTSVALLGTRLGQVGIAKSSTEFLLDSTSDGIQVT
jgi:hypothetical protein